MMMAKSTPKAAPDPALVAVVKAKSTRKPSKPAVEGFGCPKTDWPHHVRVVIPEVRDGDIQIIEDFGVSGHAAGRQDQAIRCVLPRSRWKAVADVARRDFNGRLRALGQPVGVWRPGVTKVERVLGQELILLASVCGVAEEADLAAVAASWSALRPEERWWFAGWIVARPLPQVIRGLAMLLSAGPVENTAPKLPIPKPQSALPLFDTPPAGKC